MSVCIKKYSTKYQIKSLIKIVSGAHEAPGQYATGIIVQRYTSGQTINVVVEITAHHFGFFQFKICPNEDFSLDKGQDCFDRFSVGHLKNLQN